jgi:hypothetical protein
MPERVFIRRSMAAMTRSFRKRGLKRCFLETETRIQNKLSSIPIATLLRS